MNAHSIIPLFPVWQDILLWKKEIHFKFQRNDGVIYDAFVKNCFCRFMYSVNNTFRASQAMMTFIVVFVSLLVRVRDLLSLVIVLNTITNELEKIYQAINCKWLCQKCYIIKGSLISSIKLICSVLFVKLMKMSIKNNKANLGITVILIKLHLLFVW